MSKQQNDIRSESPELLLSPNAGAGRIKVTLAGETRLVPFALDGEAKWDDLVAVLRGRFGLPEQVPVALRYRDCEGDLITLDSAVEFADLLASGQALPSRFYLADEDDGDEDDEEPGEGDGDDGDEDGGDGDDDDKPKRPHHGHHGHYHRRGPHCGRGGPFGRGRWGRRGWGWGMPPPPPPFGPPPFAFGPGFHHPPPPSPFPGQFGMPMGPFGMMGGGRGWGRGFGGRGGRGRHHGPPGFGGFGFGGHHHGFGGHHHGFGGHGRGFGRFGMGGNGGEEGEDFGFGFGPHGGIGMGRMGGFGGGHGWEE